MTHLSDKILQKIETDNISPKSKYHFLLQHYMFWIATVVSVAVGSVAVAVTMFIVNAQSWGLLQRAGGLATGLLYIIPYFWIALFVLFIVIAYYSVRHIEGGYRMALTTMAVLYVVLTMLIGWGLYAIGVGDQVEYAFAQKAPLYYHMVELRETTQHRPDEGLLLGVIKELQIDGLIVMDINGEDWLVDISKVDEDDMPFGLAPGMRIHAFGEIVGTQLFEAEEIRIPRMPLFEGRGKNSMPMRGVRP